MAMPGGGTERTASSLLSAGPSAYVMRFDSNRNATTMEREGLMTGPLRLKGMEADGEEHNSMKFQSIAIIMASGNENRT
jgi:hypothetical protein